MRLWASQRQLHVLRTIFYWNIQDSFLKSYWVFSTVQLQTWERRTWALKLTPSRAQVSMSHVWNFKTVWIQEPMVDPQTIPSPSPMTPKELCCALRLKNQAFVHSYSFLFLTCLTHQEISEIASTIESTTPQESCASFWNLWQYYVWFQTWSNSCMGVNVKETLNYEDEPEAACGKNNLVCVHACKSQLHRSGLATGSMQNLWEETWWGSQAGQFFL